jgi:hypothetical protein
LNEALVRDFFAGLDPALREKDLGIAELFNVGFGDRSSGGIELKDGDFDPSAALNDESAGEDDVLDSRDDGNKVLPFRFEDLAADSGLQPAAKSSAAKVLQTSPDGSNNRDGDLEDEVDEGNPGVGGRRSGSRRCGEEEDEVLLRFDGKTLADTFSSAKVIFGEHALDPAGFPGDSPGWSALFFRELGFGPEGFEFIGREVFEGA